MGRNSTAYEADFLAWVDEQARLLRAGNLSALDVENLIEEVESLGRQQRQQLRNRFVRLLQHLLKWEFQPSPRGPSWRKTIRHQRDRIGVLLRDSPSLRPVLDEVMAEAYRTARFDAADETGLPVETFPTENPFSVDQALDPMFPDDLGSSEQRAALKRGFKNRH
jgi:hypothetical protein